MYIYIIMERSRFERIPDVPFKKSVDYVLKLIEVDDDLSNFYRLFDNNTTLGKKLNTPFGSLSRLDIEYLYYYLNYDERPSISEENVFFEFDEVVTTQVTNQITLPTYVDLDKEYIFELMFNDDLEHGYEWPEAERNHIDTEFENSKYFF